MRARACLLSLLIIAVAAPLPAAVAASKPPKAAKVSYAMLRADVVAGKARVAEINRVAHSVTLVLKDGRRERAVYPSHQERQLARRLRAASVAIVFRHATHHSHPKHRLRYIAAGVLVLAAIGGVWVVARRRAPDQGDGSSVTRRAK
jgi:ATP-dependent Zn protease